MAEKSRELALLISFFLPGLGISYAGNVERGITILGAAVVCHFLSIFFGLIFSVIVFLLWAYGMYETYMIFQ